MRKLGSLLIMLLLLTAYGRCVADQLGVLHSSASACCQVTLSQADHCESETDEQNTCHSDGDSNHESHPEESTPEEPETEPETEPCGLCAILQSDGMLLNDGLKVPSPIVLELSHLFFTTTLDGLLDKSHTIINLENSTSEHPDPPAEHRSKLRRTIAKTTPVRGPAVI